MSSFRSSSASGRIRITEVEDLERYQIEKGSRFEIEHLFFAHWAVYLGNGMICHLTQDPGQRMSGLGLYATASVGTTKGIIVEEDFEVLLKPVVDVNNPADSEGKKQKVYLNNSADSKWTPLPADEIVKRARSDKGMTKYSVTASNCEQYVNWWRYGKFESQQVKDAVTSVGVGVGAAATLGLGAAILK